MENTIARPPRVCRYFSDRAAVHCDININKPAFQKLKYFVQEGDGGRHGLSQARSCIDLSKSGQDNPSYSSGLDMLVRDYNASLSTEVTWVVTRH